MKAMEMTDLAYSKILDQHISFHHDLLHTLNDTLNKVNDTIQK